MATELFNLSGLLVYSRLSKKQIEFLEKTYGQNWFEELALNLKETIEWLLNRSLKIVLSILTRLTTS